MFNTLATSRIIRCKYFAVVFFQHIIALICEWPRIFALKFYESLNARTFELLLHRIHWCPLQSHKHAFIQFNHCRFYDSISLIIGKSTLWSQSLKWIKKRLLHKSLASFSLKLWFNFALQDWIIISKISSMVTFLEPQYFESTETKTIKNTIKQQRYLICLKKSVLIHW